MPSTAKGPEGPECPLGHHFQVTLALWPSGRMPPPRLRRPPSRTQQARLETHKPLTPLHLVCQRRPPSPPPSPLLSMRWCPLCRRASSARLPPTAIAIHIRSACICSVPASQRASVPMRRQRQSRQAHDPWDNPSLELTPWGVELD